MRQIYLKHFALIFSLLLLVQQGHTLIQRKLIDDGVHDIIPEIKKTTHQSLEKGQQREKRFIFTTIFVITTVVSIGMEVYKQARGCKDFTPDLEPTVNKGKRLEGEIKQLQKNVEAAWKPVTTFHQYTEKLDKSLVTIREKMNRYKTLVKEIVALLDRDMLDNNNLLFKKLENDVDNQDENSIGSMEDLTTKVTSTAGFAISVTAKMITLGFATKSLLYKSTSKVAAETAGTWAAKNPGRVSSMLSRFSQAKGAIARWSSTKIAAFKAGLSSKFAGSIGLKLVKFKSVFAKLGQTTVGKALGKAISITGKALVKTGAAIAAVILFAYDVWNFIKFAKECHKKLNDAREAVRIMEKNKIELTTIQLRITYFTVQTTTAYNQMKASISSNDFKEFLREVIELGEGAQHQNADIKWATNTIKVYITYISYYNLYLTDYLNGFLVRAFDKINYRLECLKSKISIRMSVVNKCEDGSGSFSYLYNQAKNLERSITNDCIQGEYMSQSEIQGLVEEAMKLKGAQTICLRNNQDKQKLACSNLHRQYSNTQNAQSVGVTVADIEYFLTKCDTKDLSRTTKMAICAGKTQGNTFDQVKASYHSYYHSQVKVVYDNCDISDPEKVSICNLKEIGYDFNYVRNQYNLYPSSKIQEIYNGCQKRTELTPNDKRSVCDWKSSGIGINDQMYASLWELLFNKYTRPMVEAHYNSC